MKKKSYLSPLGFIPLLLSWLLLLAIIVINICWVLTVCQGLSLYLATSIRQGPCQKTMITFTSLWKTEESLIKKLFVPDQKNQPGMMQWPQATRKWKRHGEVLVFSEYTDRGYVLEGRLSPPEVRSSEGYRCFQNECPSKDEVWVALGYKHPVPFLYMIYWLSCKKKEEGGWANEPRPPGFWAQYRGWKGNWGVEWEGPVHGRQPALMGRERYSPSSPCGAAGLEPQGIWWQSSVFPCHLPKDLQKGKTFLPLFP